MSKFKQPRYGTLAFSIILSIALSCALIQTVGAQSKDVKTEITGCPEPPISEEERNAQVFDENKIYAVVEELAKPHEGIQNYMTCLHEAIVYPAEARRIGIEGRVFVEFVVNKDGCLSDYKIVKGIYPPIDSAALHAMKKINDKWLPGKQNGVVIKQRFVFPVTFKL